MVTTAYTPVALCAAGSADWLNCYINTLALKPQTMVRQAYQLMQDYYPADACTMTGENLNGNLLAAAKMVADMDLLADAVAATLLVGLPDYLPDWQVMIDQQCGHNVTKLVMGLDQIQKLTLFVQADVLMTREEKHQQAEAVRQMLLAMVSDIRVVLIKLALRTQTMNYLNQVTDEALKQHIAKETMAVFAPLANRLGIWQLKWQLEDLGFRYQQPQEYKRIARLLDEKRLERLEYIEHFVQMIKEQLNQIGRAHV